jgi:hypothetical protein
MEYAAGVRRTGMSGEDAADGIASLWKQEGYAREDHRRKHLRE